MSEALWGGVEVLAFCLIVAGVVLLFGVGWAFEVAGLLLAAVAVWRAARAEEAK